MAKRKTLMDEARDALAKDRELNQLYQRELAKLKVANQILAARQHAGLSQAALARGDRRQLPGHRGPPRREGRRVGLEFRHGAPHHSRAKPSGMPAVWELP